MKIEIKDGFSDVVTRTLKSKKDGEEYTFREQTGYLSYSKSPVPVAVVIPLDDDQQGYPVGVYGVDLEESMQVNRYGRVALRLRLLKTPASIKKAS